MLVTWVAAALLVLAAVPGPGVLALALLVVQAAYALGWTRVAPSASEAGGVVVTLLAAAAADLLLVLHHGQLDDPRPAGLAGVLAAGVVAEFVHQLGRHGPRPELTRGLTVTVAAVALVVSGALLVAARQSVGGAGLVVAVVLAVVVARTAWLLPLAALLRALVGVGLGAVAGLVVGLVTHGSLGAVAGVVAGALAAVLAQVAETVRVELLTATTQVVATPGRGRRRRARRRTGLTAVTTVDLALGTMPLLLAGPVAYVVSRILLG